VSAQNNGGPAFPIPGVTCHYDDGSFKDPDHGGMTLRDYCATKFAAAWVVALSARHCQPGYSDTEVVYEANRLGLAQADAMLAAREES
jgi:hypothetical protein